MVYTKTTWVNDTSPAINDTNLNNMEDGIYKAQDFGSGEHIGDIPTARMSTNIATAILDKDIVPKTIVLSNVTDELGSLKIYRKDADAIILGDATHEGGDISIYRDSSGNKQFFLDADAASNVLALSVYGGVVAQNYLTIGRTYLETGYSFYNLGSSYLHDTARIHGQVYCNGLVNDNANLTAMPFNISVSDSANHAIKLQIDTNDIIVAQATGNGSGGIDLATRAIGVLGATPQVQQAHIADVAAAAGDPPTKAEFDAFATKFNTLLADQEGFGFLATT